MSEKAEEPWQALLTVVVVAMCSMMTVLMVGTWFAPAQSKKVVTVQCSTHFMDKARKVHFQFTDECEVDLTEWRQ